MTNEEAKDELKNNSCYECSYGCHSATDCIAECAYKDAVNKATEALEKQIPKPVTGVAATSEEAGKIGHNNCPGCGYLVSGRYCSYCGQRLSWMEEENEKL